jgi:hypothetical protein
MSRYILPLALVISVIGPMRSHNLFAPGECLMLPSPGDITALADFDKDGDLDAVVFTSAESVGYVLMNDGGGKITLVVGLIPNSTPLAQTVSAPAELGGSRACGLR